MRESRACDIDEYVRNVVFREKAGTAVASVIKDGNTLITTAPYAERKGGLYPDVKDNFTISVWIRPEVDSGMSNNAGVTSGSTWGGNANSYPYAWAISSVRLSCSSFVAKLSSSRRDSLIWKAPGCSIPPKG